MSNLSQNQLLELWGELARAYYGDNYFGRDTAEIYSRSFNPYDPILVSKGHIDTTSSFWGDYAKSCKTAYNSFIALLKKFEKNFECIIELDGHRLKKLPKKNEFRTRYHVKVIPLQNNKGGHHE